MTAQTCHDYAGALVHNRRGTDGLLELLKLHHYVPGKLEPTVPNIQQAICEHFKIRRDDLLSSVRTLEVARARQIGMYLVRTLSKGSIAASYPKLARAFMRTDHSTAIHACRRIPKLCLQDWKIAHDVAQLEARLS